MYRYRLTKVVLQNGDEIEPVHLNVIVGPNNSGKSRFLKEMIGRVTSEHSGGLLVREVECMLPSNLEELANSYSIEPNKTTDGRWMTSALEPNLCEGFSASRGDWQSRLQRLSEKPTQHWMHSKWGKELVAHLTTEHRLQLVKQRETSENHHERGDLLQELYQANKGCERDLRRKIQEAFNTDIALDFTALRSILLRLGSDFSDLPGDPREARKSLSKCEKLDEQGDGLRAYVGLVVAMLAVRRDLFLVDEPEAFLHPPQAFRMGAFLAEQAKANRQIFIATHSADVLRGVLSSGVETKIIRIDRVGNTNSFRTLPADKIRSIVTDPLLSSARVLDGLFYGGVVVVEADADARFYHTVSTKLCPNLDLHFVNADNKQTVPRIMGIYHDLGVRCAGIVDFDVLNEPAEFSKQIEALRLNESERNEAKNLRGQIAQLVDEKPAEERLVKAQQQLQELVTQNERLIGHAASSRGDVEKQLKTVASRCREIAETTKAWKEFKRLGRTALSSAVRPIFDRLYEIGASNGLFINPCGELESMLKDCGTEHTTDKRQWISKALQLLPKLNVDASEYPWKFINEVHSYLTTKSSNSAHVKLGEANPESATSNTEGP